MYVDNGWDAFCDDLLRYFGKEVMKVVWLGILPPRFYLASEKTM